MKHRATFLLAFSALSLGLAAGTATADNLLGLYVGGGVGESTVRSDNGFDPDYPTDSHPHHTAWQVMAGVRPIPFLGAEAEYIDFGHPDSADNYSLTSPIAADSHPKAGVLSGVGYLPLPFVPLVDVFAKLGVARLETNVNSYSEVACGEGTCALALTRQGVWETKVAYGAGVQAHFLGLAVRGEYERISSTLGDPDAFMLSATWTF
jgi:opacity protein-like surface antigen